MKSKIFVVIISVCLSVLFILILNNYFPVFKGVKQDALSELKGKLRDNPYSAELHYKLSQYYLDRGMLDEYEKELLIAKEISPNAYLYPEKLADHYFKMGKYEKAITYYKEVLNLEGKKELLALFKIGNSYNNLGDKEEAIKYYKMQLESLKEQDNPKNEKMTEFIVELLNSLQAHQAK